MRGKDPSKHLAHSPSELGKELATRTRVAQSMTDSSLEVKPGRPGADVVYPVNSAAQPLPYDKRKRVGGTPANNNKS